MIYVWIALTVVFVIAEAATAQLTTVWFALGSVVALILAACGVESLTVQIIVFIAVSAITLIATRPLVKKMLKKKVVATNADRNIGETGITLSEINNLEATGEVKVKGVVWTARSENGDVIPKGVKVRVKKIEGVKLIVETI
ncbi:MAG: NfeD family protein [Clostridia bacterium]|nr:NfeD family protein [Clostridia bacterium]MBR5423579.1 NfeD family protein [Clostridia bacterium]